MDLLFSVFREFLKRDFAVIFLHRQDSLVPFEHELRSLRFEDFELDGQELKLSKPKLKLLQDPNLEQDKLIQTFLCYHQHKQNLLKISYFSVADYLFLLGESAKLLAPLGHRVIFFLAAAVSDFYLDDAFISEHKISSSSATLIENGLSIHLSPVPKFIRLLKEQLCPAAFIISFKLETDETIVLKKAEEALQRYGHDLVIANVLSSRKEKVWLVHPDGRTDLIEKSESVPIEHDLVRGVSQIIN